MLFKLEMFLYYLIKSGQIFIYLLRNYTEKYQQSSSIHNYFDETGRFEKNSPRLCVADLLNHVEL